MNTPASPTARILDKLKPLQEQVGRRFAHLRGQVRRQLTLEAAAWFVGTAVGLAALSLLYDWLFRPETTARRILGPALALVLLAVFFRRVIQPLRAAMSDLHLADAIDRHRPGTSQQAAAVLQLPNLLHSEAHTSPAMVQAAVLENAANLEKADFSRFLDRSRTTRYASLLIFVLLAPLAFILDSPATAWLWTQRWLLGSSLRWPQTTYLTIDGLGPNGKIRTPRGEPLMLRVSSTVSFVPTDLGWRVEGRPEEFAASIDRKPESRPPGQVRLDFTTAGGVRTRATFTKLRDDLFQYELPPIHESLSATVTGGDDWRGPFSIEPVDRPSIAKMTLTNRIPGVSEPPVVVDAFAGQHLALQDSTLELEIVGNAPLRRVGLKPDVGATPRLERVDGKTFVTRWRMKESQTFEIVLAAEGEELASRPVFLTVGLLKDRPPRVTVQASGVGRRVTPMARIPLLLRAQDDFGLTSLVLDSETAAVVAEKPVIARQTKPLSLDDPNGGKKALLQVEKQLEFPLRPLQAAVGATVSIKGVGMDNCVQGRQKGESRAVQFQIVPPDELFYEILTRQRAERARFQAALTNAENQFGVLTKATSTDPLAGVLRAQQIVDREVWQIANRLDGTLLELRLNEIGNPQALDLLETKILAPLRQLHEERMVELRQKLQAAAGDVKGLPDARTAQGQVVVEMRRILQQMSQWEGFVDVVNQLKQIITMENGVLERTEAKKKEAKEELFDK